MHRNRPTTALTWLLLVALVVNSTTAPAIAHTHSDWEITGNHHFGGYGLGKHYQTPASQPTTGQPTTGQPTTGQPTTGQPTTGHLCDHGHRHHRGGLHAHSMRAERAAAAKLDRDRDSASLSVVSVVRHWHVSWLAVEFTIPAPPEGSSDSDRDQDAALSVVRLYDHTSPVIRADVGGKLDLASCCESVVSSNFDDSAFGAVGSASASPPLLCELARPQRSSILRI